MDDEAITGWAVAARAGDRDAAAAFVRATAEQLRRVLTYLGDRHEVDDLVQETYLRAFAALPEYSGQAPARLWLLAIARRVAADHVRRVQRRPRTISLHDQVTLERGGSSVAGRVELSQAVAALELDRREAVVLTGVLGLSYAEAAEVCGCPVGTIRSRVFRARADLLTSLGLGEDSGSAGQAGQ